MIWAQKSAARYAQLVSDALRRREEIASPRRRKMAAAAEGEKRRKQKDLRRKERVSRRVGKVSLLHTYVQVFSPSLSRSRTFFFPPGFARYITHFPRSHTYRVT